MSATTRIQVIGYDLARLQFDRLTKEQATRLEEVTKHLRQAWRRFQVIPDVGGTGSTIHQMAGSVMHHLDVDGDCFLTRDAARPISACGTCTPATRWQNTSAISRPTGGNARQLGVETDRHGRPVAYLFGAGGDLSRLNWGYSSYGGTSSNVRRVAAGRVLHVRDRSGEVTAVRGWPRCTTVIEDIARLDEWYSALVRSATMRAAVGVALQKLEGMGAVRRPWRAGGQLARADQSAVPKGRKRRSRPRMSGRISEFAANAGTASCWLIRAGNSNRSTRALRPGRKRKPSGCLNGGCARRCGRRRPRCSATTRRSRSPPASSGTSRNGRRSKTGRWC